ncbi:endonuclease/exonuclease/phosphatase family protein [Alienimonas chondri]|uniref:Endonuclease/exonuclease/phosphatase domain-containing protein n=1 Tax=Alienimonas chondri TaxID=2681879 RepID=A0ABX1V8I9_9PLAN|nr:endonuclease/exonuclease/phosphatase family protein [Alienimonas chondri]NNJ24463.1 hypothetical protein [Alienimonas chondri]
MTDTPAPADDKSDDDSPDRERHTVGRLRRWSAHLLGGAAALLLLATVLGYFGEHAWLLDLTNEWRLQYALLALLLTAALLALRSWRWLAVAGVVAGLNLWVILPWMIGGGPEVPPGVADRDLRLMTLNVRVSNDDFAPLRQLLAEAKPDVAVLLEVDREWLAEIRELSAGYEIVDTPTQERFGTLLLSRRPLKDVKFESFGEKWSSSIIVQLEVNGQPVTVIATHPPAPISTKTWRNRNQHLRELTRYVNGIDTPVLVAGDLNVTMWSPHFRRLVDEAQLADARDGYGLLPTFPATRLGVGFGWPLRIPLDHVLVSEEWATLDCDTPPGIGSDHLPVSVDVALPPAP